VNGDERTDSLAEQAAAWVPPWERRTGDAAAPAPGGADADGVAAGSAPGGAAVSGQPAAVPGGDVDAAGAPGGASDGETSGEAEIGDGPASRDGGAELPPLSGEARTPPTVDAPQPMPGDDDTDPLGPAIAASEAPAPGETTEPDAAPVDAPADLPDPDAWASAEPWEISQQGAARGSGDAEPTADAAELRSVEMIYEGELRAALEAILLVVDEPVTDVVLAQILDQPTERVAALLEELSAEYTAAGRGFDLRRAAGGWRLYTRPEYAGYVERFVLDGQSVRLTQAALETLAVVAYKQPVTRSRISAIRGVNCDGVVRTLVTRGLIEECGTEPDTGAYLYRTTTLFLEKLGLNSVDQLPPLAPFLPDDVEEEVFDAQR
jgi:segregation and condensation protein B